MESKRTKLLYSHFDICFRSGMPGFIFQIISCRGLLFASRGYARNAEIERRDCEAALAARSAIAETISYESDGHPCIPVDRRPSAEWERDVLAAMNLDPSARFVSKPYRGQAELLAELKGRFPEIPVAFFDEEEPNWRESAASSVELFRRLRAGETPALVACKVVPYYLQANGYLVRDEWRSVPAGKNSMQYFRYAVLPEGGHWSSPPMPVAVAELEEISARAATSTLAIDHEHAPAVVVRGPFTKQIVERLAKQLYDPHLLQKLDAEGSFRFVQFDCGRVLDCQSMLLSHGRPELYCHKSVGYQYPGAAINLIEQELAARGLDLEATLRRAKAFESSEDDFERYPRDIAAELDAIADVPGMEVLKVGLSSGTSSWVLLGWWAWACWRARCVFS